MIVISVIANFAKKSIAWCSCCACHIKMMCRIDTYIHCFGSESRKKNLTNCVERKRIKIQFSQILFDIAINFNLLRNNCLSVYTHEPKKGKKTILWEKRSRCFLCGGELSNYRENHETSNQHITTRPHYDDVDDYESTPESHKNSFSKSVKNIGRTIEIEREKSKSHKINFVLFGPCSCSSNNSLNSSYSFSLFCLVFFFCQRYLNWDSVCCWAFVEVVVNRSRALSLSLSEWRR